MLARLTGMSLEHTMIFTVTVISSGNMWKEVQEVVGVEAAGAISYKRLFHD
jgi:hypothetical protein